MVVPAYLSRKDLSIQDRISGGDSQGAQRQILSWFKNGEITAADADILTGNYGLKKVTPTIPYKTQTNSSAPGALKYGSLLTPQLTKSKTVPVAAKEVTPTVPYKTQTNSSVPGALRYGNLLTPQLTKSKTVPVTAKEVTPTVPYKTQTNSSVPGALKYGNLLTPQLIKLKIIPASTKKITAVSDKPRQEIKAAPGTVSYSVKANAPYDLIIKDKLTAKDKQSAYNQIVSWYNTGKITAEDKNELVGRYNLEEQDAVRHRQILGQSEYSIENKVSEGSSKQAFDQIQSLAKKGEITQDERNALVYRYGLNSFEYKTDMNMIRALALRKAKLNYSQIKQAKELIKEYDNVRYDANDPNRYAVAALEDKINVISAVGIGALHGVSLGALDKSIEDKYREAGLADYNPYDASGIQHPIATSAGELAGATVLQGGLTGAVKAVPILDSGVSIAGKAISTSSKSLIKPQAASDFVMSQIVSLPASVQSAIEDGINENKTPIQIAKDILKALGMSAIEDAAISNGTAIAESYLISRETVNQMAPYIEKIRQGNASAADIKTLNEIINSAVKTGK